MNNEKITINGLEDNISILENDNTSEPKPFLPEDIIYNDLDPISLGIEEV